MNAVNGKRGKPLRTMIREEKVRVTLSALILLLFLLTDELRPILLWVAGILSFYGAVIYAVVCRTPRELRDDEEHLIT